jgi:hypothetical protein
MCVVLQEEILNHIQTVIMVEQRASKARKFWINVLQE